MATKKNKGKKERDTRTEAVPTIAELSKIYEDRIETAKIDLINDLNEDFFNKSNQLVNALAMSVHIFVASKLKRYVDLLARMHSRYVKEVNDNEIMRTKIKTADEKLRLALETTVSSTQMYDQLKISLEEAWRTADAVTNREAILQAQMQLLVPMDIYSKHEMTQQEDTSVLPSIRLAVFRERDRLSLEVKELEKRLELNRFYVSSLENIIGFNKDSIFKLQMRNKMLQNDIRKLENRIKLLEAELDQNTNLLNNHNNHHTTQIELNNIREDVKEMTHLNDTLKHDNEKLSHDYLVLQKAFSHMENERNKLQANANTLQDIISGQKNIHSECEARFKDLSVDFKKKNYELLASSRKLHQTSQKIGELNNLLINNKNHEAILKKKLFVSSRLLNDMTRLKEDMLRQRNKARLDAVHLNDVVSDMKHEMLMQNNNMENLRLDLQTAHKHLDDNVLMIKKLKKEKNELTQENNDLHVKIESLQDELEVRAQRLSLLTEQLQNKQHDYIMVKKQRETIHAEKLMLQKTLNMNARERDNLQNINTKMGFQVNQLTHEISINEKDIIQLKIRIEMLNNEMKCKQVEIHNLENQLKCTREDLREIKARYDQAQHTLNIDEKRLMHMSLEVEEMRKQKSLVGLQMVRRNDELVLLKHRAAMMRIALDRGTVQYHNRIEDIRLLKLEITNLRMSNDCLTRAVESTANMRNEIVRLERELNRERLRVAAFTEEMQRPCRIRRWRVVRGKDPSFYELLLKVQTLLKRNIKLTTEKANIENQVKEVKKMYDGLKAQLKYIPDPSVKERLNRQQRINRNQMRKIKALRAELSVCEIDLKTQECIIDGYKRKLSAAHPLAESSKKSSIPSITMKSNYETALTDIQRNENYTCLRSSDYIEEFKKDVYDDGTALQAYAFQSSSGLESVS